MQSLYISSQQKFLLSISLAALITGLIALALPFTPRAGAESAASIADITATSTSDGTSEMLSWTSEVPTVTQVEYGTTTDYGTFSAIADASTMVTTHSLTLSDLMPNTTYHFAILSTAADASNTPVVSEDQTFTTNANNASSSEATSTTEATSTDMASSTPDFTNAPSFCNTSASNEGYFVTTDLGSYMQGQTINFCLADNTRTPLVLSGTHPWQVTDQNGNVIFTPDAGALSTTTMSNFFSDSWNGMNGSSTNVTPGTYMIVFPGFPGSPSATFSITGSTPTSGNLSDLITQLQTLQINFPNWAGQIGSFIDQLNAGTSTTSTGTTTQSNSMGAWVDQGGGTFKAGGSIDFGGHNFGHDENVTIKLNGQWFGQGHADGGGNFSTGSLTLPATPGSYMFVFTGDSSGATVPVSITLQ